MRRADLEGYLQRDWARIARAKQERWARRRRRLGPQEGFRLAGELYAQVSRQRSGGPDVESRRADLEHHQRLAEKLRAVGGR